MENTYIKDKKVLGITTIDKKTPSGGEMIQVLFENGATAIMPKTRYNLVKSNEVLDASKFQMNVRRSVGSIVYGILHEYGLTFGETNNVLDEAAELTQSAADKATNILFNVEYPEDRTVNQINDILIEHDHKNNNNETTPAGGGSDTKNS